MITRKRHCCPLARLDVIENITFQILEDKTVVIVVYRVRWFQIDLLIILYELIISCFCYLLLY